MRLILLLINEAGTPTSWITAPTMEALIADLQVRWSTPLLPELIAALRACPPEPSRTGRIPLGMLGERWAFLLAERGSVMHHFEGPGGTLFNYNSGLSGEVRTMSPEGRRGVISGRDLLAFAADYIRRQRISQLEEASDEEILGCPELPST